MITPGCLFGVSSRLRIQSGADPTPDHFDGGFGFNSDGRLCLATGAPTGNIYYKGFRFSAKGAVYAVNSASAPDHYVGPYGLDANDALIFGNLSPTYFVDGVGFVSTGRLATINS